MCCQGSNQPCRPLEAPGCEGGIPDWCPLPYQSERDTVLILLEKWMESEVKDIDENGEGIWSKNDVIDRLQRTWEKIAELHQQAGEP